MKVSERDYAPVAFFAAWVLEQKEDGHLDAGALTWYWAQNFPEVLRVASVTHQVKVDGSLIEKARLLAADAVTMALERGVIAILNGWLPPIVDDFTKIQVRKLRPLH